MILPIVKCGRYNDGNYLLSYQIHFSVKEEWKDKLAVLMECFFPKCKLSFCESPFNIIAVCKKMSKKEAYKIKIDGNGIYIEYGEYAGLRNALATVSMMAVANKEGFSLRYTEIEDYPVAEHRGVMLDLARGIKPYQILCEDIVLIARSKMNFLHLHLSDSAGVCVKLDCLQEECCLENHYSKEQMRKIGELAEALGVEVIPEFDMPGHSKTIAKYYTQIDCVPEGVENTHWTTCAGSEETYLFYENIINELCELFPGKYFHIGGDELEFADLPELQAFCHWEKCPKCRKKCEEENLKDRQELYNYFINRIHDIVKKAGRKMVMWSDQIDCMRPAALSDDILMQFWRVAAPGRGPFEGCSFNEQLKMGYKIINSYYPETYLDCEEYMSGETISDWRWDQRPECDEEYKKCILGGEMCVWEYGNVARYSHYERTLAPAVFVMADKLWNGNHIVFDKTYETALSKAVLGIGVQDDVNLFECFGSVIPPRNDEYAYYDKINCDVNTIEETLKKLNAILILDSGSERRIRNYGDALRNIVNMQAHHG